MRRDFEGAEVEFLRRVGGRRQVDQRERRLGELPPDREIFGRDGEPAVPEHVPSGLRDASGFLPCNLVDHRLPLGAWFLKNHITMIRRPEPADRMRVVYPVTMDPARGASVTASFAFAARSPSVTGNCSTVARWPSQSCVTSTWLPSGNSIASWWRSDTSGSIWLNLP